jgi:hypothetical protein
MGESNPNANTYAAIRLTRDTIMTIMANVAEVPMGQEKLVYAMLKYPFRADVAHYYIGGNYLRMSYPDFTQQILTQSELDVLFTYRERGKVIPGRLDPAKQWFPVTLRVKRSAAMVVG